AYQYPLYAEPSDLITVDLVSIDPDLKGKRLRGRLQGNKLVPFFDRASWERLGPDREEPIVWVDDELDAFLLQVQGSGRVKLPDGQVIRLSYANQNGHPYKSIGGVLVRWGELTVEQATIPGIRAWAVKNPKRLQELLNSNPSVVFFEENKVLNPEQGPVGALGVPLKAQVSIAIDRSRIPYGSMMWLESTHPETGDPIKQGTLAQDTGGAIRGRVRADYFWGTGPVAGRLAGVTRQPLKMWLLWPKDAPLPSVD
ncbi:MAG: MltA domain-containing protein, partial [Limnobacter sp.]|nr:MltA domain-containing protein [Limnobacter sp.]